MKEATDENVSMLGDQNSVMSGTSSQAGCIELPPGAGPKAVSLLSKWKTKKSAVVAQASDNRVTPGMLLIRYQPCHIFVECL